MSLLDVVVCVATYRRPGMLRGLLDDLAKQELGPDTRFAVAVADNDREPSAEPEVRAASIDHPSMEIHYVHEPRNGVSYARNASVAAAPPARFLAFVDDDERVSTTWLRELLATQQRTGASVVVGPVFELLPPTAPRWYQEGGFADVLDLPDGAPVSRCYAGNMLVEQQAIERIAGPFDHRFVTTGGEDTFLSLNLAEAGTSMVWSPDATVCTEVPDDRLAASFVLRREFVGASSYTRGERMLKGFRPLRLASGSGRVITGLATAAAGAVLRRQAQAMRGLGQAATGAGVVAGALGVRRLPGWW